MAKSQSSAKAAIVLPPLNLARLTATIVGDTSLICHTWSQKARLEMLAKQTKKAQQAKEAKDPVQDFRDSLYKIETGGYGFPSVAIKDAMVTAVTSVSGLTKVAARQSFRVVGERSDVRAAYESVIIRQNLVPIISPEPMMREDMVRVGMGTADIRYRGEFFPWAMRFQIGYNANLFSAEQLLNLLNVAGFGVGIGEWRAERNGESGAFHVATADDLDLLLELGINLEELGVKPKHRKAA